MSSFNPAMPQGPDIPADSQDEFLSNFQLLNQYFGVDHVPFGNTISFATNANPCVCTSSDHGLSNGDTVYISHFGSLVGDLIQLWNINGGPYTVTVIDINTFSINADASANPVYYPNSGAFVASSIKYGFHKKTYFPNVQSFLPNDNPLRPSPYSAYYSKAQKNPSIKDDINLAELFFQKTVGIEDQLTNLNLVEVNTNFGKGVKTPWGLIINFGQITFKSSPQVYDLPIPFTTAFWSITGTLQNEQQQPGIISLWRLAAVGLTQFEAMQRRGRNIRSSQATCPGFYLALGY